MRKIIMALFAIGAVCNLSACEKSAKEPETLNIADNAAGNVAGPDVQTGTVERTTPDAQTGTVERTMPEEQTGTVERTTPAEQ
jgi:hypothetical protein